MLKAPQDMNLRPLKEDLQHRSLYNREVLVHQVHDLCSPLLLDDKIDV